MVALLILFIYRNVWVGYLQYIMIGINVFFVVFFYFYIGYIFKKYFRKNLEEQYSGRFGLQIKLLFLENEIIEQSTIGKFNLNLENLSRIVQIKDYYFFVFFNLQALIIPVNAIHNLSAFRSYVEVLKSKYQISEKVALQWKWR